MEDTVYGCKCSPSLCDTSTNSPHKVAFAPQAAKASNCQYFAASSSRIQSSGIAVLLLENPSDSETIFYVTIESVSNYGPDAVTAYLAGNPDLSDVKCCDVPIFQTNLGCSSPSAAKVRQAGTHVSVLCMSELLTQDIIAPLSTLRIDHQGGFVVTPGSTLAVAAAGLYQLCPSKAPPALLDVGIDLRWWETPCNSHS